MAKKDRGSNRYVPRPNVCILSDIETAELRSGRPVSCDDHDHCSVDDARDLCWPEWMKTASDHFEPVAEIVGPHQIRMLRASSWKVQHASLVPLNESSYPPTLKLRISTLQLVGSAS